jgi:hypothetical protein
MDTLDGTHGLSKQALSSRIEQSGRNHFAERRAAPLSPPNKEVRQKSHAGHKFAKKVGPRALVFCCRRLRDDLKSHSGTANDGRLLFARHFLC